MKNYIFGYGSLIEKNSRLRTVPSALNAFPVKIRGYARGWWSRTGNVGLSTTFLGCIKTGEIENFDVVNYVTGVLFEVTDNDLTVLDEREQGYKRINVNVDKIDDYANLIHENSKIWIYVNEFKDRIDIEEDIPSKQFPIVQSYVDICMNGCIEIEDLFPVAKRNKFATEFIKSTCYWSSYWVNDRIYPRRPFIAVPNASKIDFLLKENLPDSIFDNIYFE